MSRKLSNEEKRDNKISQIRAKAIGKSLGDNPQYKSLRKNFMEWIDYPELGVDEVPVGSTTIKGRFYCSTPGCLNEILSRTLDKIIRFNPECKCKVCKKTTSALKRTATEAKNKKTIGQIAECDEGERGRRAKMLLDAFIEFEDFPNLQLRDCVWKCSYTAQWICMGRTSECEKTFSRNVQAMTDLSRTCYCRKCSKYYATLKRIKTEGQNNPLAKSDRYLEIVNSEEGAYFLYCVDFPQLKPEEIPEKSSLKLKWQCKKCHMQYESTASNTTDKNAGCPYCAGSKALWGKNDLRTYLMRNHSKKMKQWDLEKNGPMENYSYSSDKIVSWKCEWCGSEYRRSISKEMRSLGLCKNCLSRVNDSIAQRMIYFYLKETFPEIEFKYKYKDKWLEGRELDIYFEVGEHRYGVEYDGPQHIKEKDEEKDKLCGKKLFRLIRVREPEAGNYDPKTKNVEIIRRSSSALDGDLDSSIKSVIRIITNNEKAAACKEITIDSRKDLMQVLDRPMFTAVEDRSLARVKPTIAKFLDTTGYDISSPLQLAESIYAESNFLYRFQHEDVNTKKMHYWISSLHNMKEPRNPKSFKCPVCNRRQLQPGINDFASLYPDLLKDWDDSNEIDPRNILGAPSIKVPWKCAECSRTYFATFNDRVYHGTQCPCKNKSRKKVKATNLDDGRIIEADSETELAKWLGYKKNTVANAVANGRALGANSRAINCTYTDQNGNKTTTRYESIVEASRATGITKSMIRKSKENNEEIRGHLFAATITKGWKLEYSTAAVKNGKKKVMNIDTGVYYESITDAAKETGIGRSNISTALKTGIKAGGQRWKLVD